LLARHGCSKEVIEHSKAVTKKAIELSNSFLTSVDLDLVIAGSMLHDIGRSQTHGIDHIIVGSRIAKEEGLSEEIIKIIERHVGAGLTKEEAKNLGLPQGDYLPITPEETVVSYADNLTSGTKHLSFGEALSRFKSRLGDDHPAVERFKKQHVKIKEWSMRS
jgi:uncharacterized protein